MARVFGILGITTLLLAGVGCNPGEGDRCNPLLFNDECGSVKLPCTYPPNCGVAYCCPTPDKVTPSTSSNCLACATDDAGTTD